MRRSSEIFHPYSRTISRLKKNIVFLQKIKLFKNRTDCINAHDFVSIIIKIICI